MAGAPAGPPLIVIELVIGFAVPIGWAVWELVKLRREQARDRERERLQAQSSDPPSPASRG